MAEKARSMLFEMGGLMMAYRVLGLLMLVLTYGLTGLINFICFIVHFVVLFCCRFCLLGGLIAYRAL